MMSVDPVRSRMMSNIRTAKTTPETVVGRSLHARGFRYRCNDRALPGRPDLVFRRRNAVILVHGCFWHRHEGCSRSNLPKRRAEFWEEKLEKNRSRDARNILALRELGWRVAVVWECATRDAPEYVAVQLDAFLRGTATYAEITSPLEPLTAENTSDAA